MVGYQTYLWKEAIALGCDVASIVDLIRAGRSSDRKKLPNRHYGRVHMDQVDHQGELYTVPTISLMSYKRITLLPCFCRLQRPHMRVPLRPGRTVLPAADSFLAYEFNF